MSHSQPKSADGGSLPDDRPAPIVSTTEILLKELGAARKLLGQALRRTTGGMASEISEICDQLEEIEHEVDNDGPVFVQ